jgi:2-polyprenyl-6-methoxyphenol hydroxylase-like FAD-dependent oxidoreductase
LDFSDLEGATAFPNSILIGQHTTESIFRDKLKHQGISVYTNKTVVDIRNVKPTGNLEVIFADGSVTHTKYVVGADGARSTVGNLI